MKQCNHCGSKDLQVYGSGSVYLGNINHCVVQCNNCKALGPTAHSKVEAIAKWDRRCGEMTPDKALQILKGKKIKRMLENLGDMPTALELEAIACLIKQRKSQ